MQHFTVDSDSGRLLLLLMWWLCKDGNGNYCGEYMSVVTMLGGVCVCGGGVEQYCTRWRLVNWEYY